MIEGVGDAKFGPLQADRLAALRRLQHVLRGQRGRSLMAQDKRILQKLDDVGFLFKFAGPLPSFRSSGSLSPVIADQMK